MSKEVQMTFRVEPVLRAEFMDAVAADEVSAAQVLRDCMQTYVDGHKARLHAQNGDMLPAEEQLRREEAACFARASVALEGIAPSAKAGEQILRHVAGKLSLADLLAHVQQSGPVRKSSSKAQSREQQEADITFMRIYQLELDPVQGSFDAAHLKEVHRRIFQDFAGLGLADVAPGDYRKPLPGNAEWLQQRSLTSMAGPVYVVYSRMDGTAEAQLEKTLDDAAPAFMRQLEISEFINRLAETYIGLDYAHPFVDGNSLTLRTFTRQLARESGYELDWSLFGASDAARDLLYIARDSSVNALAKTGINDRDNLRKINHTEAWLHPKRGLPDLLHDIVRVSEMAVSDAAT